MSARESLAGLQSATGTLVDGLRNHAEQLATRGWDVARTNKLDGLIAQARTLNSEQEALKSQLKVKTAELGTTTDQIEVLKSEAKKLVKLTIDQKQWKEFGIDDKR